MSDFTSEHNPILPCITVDDDAWSATNWTNTDATTSFSLGRTNLCSTLQPASISKGTEEGNQISIYPNPTNGQITIDLNEFTTNITLGLVNSLGQSIYFQNFENPKQISFEIDAPKRFYFLKLDSDSGKNEVIKIIKE